MKQSVILQILCYIIIPIILIYIAYEISTLNSQSLDQIYAILVPIAYGGLITSSITNHWQKQKESNEIKRKILKELDDSLIAYYTLISNFRVMIFDAYVDENTSKIVSENIRQTQIKFPTNESEVPNKKFEEEIKVFNSKYWNLTYSVNSFGSSLALYYPESNFLKDMGDIYDKIGTAYLLTRKWIISRKEEEFKKWDDELENKLAEIHETTYKLAMKIAEKNITVR